MKMTEKDAAAAVDELLSILRGEPVNGNLLARGVKRLRQEAEVEESFTFCGKCAFAAKGGCLMDSVNYGAHDGCLYFIRRVGPEE